MDKILYAAIVICILASCGKKEGASQVNDANITHQDTITDVDRLEGKVVMSETGEWYVIKNGERYRAMSEPATTDYLNSIADGTNHVVRSVPNETLEQFPVAGEILPKVVFQRDR